MKKKRSKYSLPKVPYGYRKSKKDKYSIEIYEPEARYVRFMYKKYEEGYKIGEIVQMLNSYNEKICGKIDVDYLKRLDNTDTIEQLMRLHDTKFKYTSDNDYPDRSLVLNNKLDNYLASKRDELNEKHNLAEFNLSRWKAKKVLEKFRYN